MATTLSSSLQIINTSTLTSPSEAGAEVWSSPIDVTATLTNGTGAAQGNRKWDGDVTIAASGTAQINIASLTPPVGPAITDLAAVKKLIIQLVTTTANSRVDYSWEWTYGTFSGSITGGQTIVPIMDTAGAGFGTASPIDLSNASAHEVTVRVWIEGCTA